MDYLFSREESYCTDFRWNLMQSDQSQKMASLSSNSTRTARNREYSRRHRARRTTQLNELNVRDSYHNSLTSILISLPPGIKAGNTAKPLQGMESILIPAAAVDAYLPLTYYRQRRRRSQRLRSKETSPRPYGTSKKFRAFCISSFTVLCLWCNPAINAMMQSSLRNTQTWLKRLVLTLLSLRFPQLGRTWIRLLGSWAMTLGSPGSLNYSREYQLFSILPRLLSYPVMYEQHVFFLLQLLLSILLTQYLLLSVLRE